MKLKLSTKARKNLDTGIQCMFGLAAATPLLLQGSGVDVAVGAGAAVLAVSVFVTNLMQVPAVERFLDRLLGVSGSLQPVKEAALALKTVEEHERLLHSAPPTSSGSVGAAPESGAQPDPGASV